MTETTPRLYGWWREAIGAIVVLISRLLTMPRTPWENDEFLFAEGVKNFDPSRYHPHPPGYPLYILLGKAVNFIVNDAWRSLEIISVVCAVVGFVAIARAFRHWIDDPDLAVSGALLFYFSASMLVHGTLALSDGPSIAFLALAFWAMSRAGDEGHDRNAIAIGLWTSAAIGVRPQLVVPLLPAFAVSLWQLRTMHRRLTALITFAVVSLMWFLPLVDAAGGFDALVAYERKQALYFASHDAAMSRGAMSTSALVARFLFHPWGFKYITIPLALCVIAGIGIFVRRWGPTLLPLLVFTAVQVVFELGWMDPADAARYALPSMILVALVAACGFDLLRRRTQIAAAPWLAAAFFAAMSIGYAWPLLRTRTTSPSPVAAAASYANTHFPPNTVVLYDLSLRPHAEYLLHFRTEGIEPGMREDYDRPNVPLVFFVDGGAHEPDAKEFAWPESDAYGKLTRNLYRRVTLDPVQPFERSLPLQGVYALERTIAGEDWRWLAPSASIRLPHQHGRDVQLGFRLSPDTPYDANGVHVFVNGRPAASLNAVKVRETTVTIPLPPSPQIDLRFDSDHFFMPATVLHNQDPRTLATQLVDVETH